MDGWMDGWMWIDQLQSVTFHSVKCINDSQCIKWCK